MLGGGASQQINVSLRRIYLHRIALAGALVTPHCNMPTIPDPNAMLAVVCLRWGSTMSKPNQLIVLGLCCVLSVSAIACRGRQAVEDVDQPPPEDELPLDLEVDETPEQDSTDESQAAAPTPSPAPRTETTGKALSPPQAAQLIAAQPESRINLRSQPSTTASAKGYGLVGDPVQLLRSAQGGDGTWYYVKFEQSGAEGWIRGDFINIAGRATPLPAAARPENSCEGLAEAMTFTAYHSDGRFTLVRFVNLETQNTFDSTLSRQGSNTQGQPLYQGSASPPTGGTYRVELVDLSGGNPGNGSQVTIDYYGILGRGTCK